MSSSLKAYIGLARPHHWLKNGFVLVPAFFAGQLQNLSLLPMIAAAFVLFCFVSSSIYIFNDLNDCEADRQHAKKSARPLPSGRMSKQEAVLLCIALTAGSVLILLWMHPPIIFTAVVLLYVAVNIGYSMGLKHVAILELFLLASGYLFRLVAGAEIAHETLTGWIIITTVLVALLMAAGKRRGDLAQMNDRMNKRKSLESYSLAYLDQIIAMLGAATVVTYLLFCISDYAQMRFGNMIVWSSVFVLYGIMRYIQILTVESGGDAPATVLYRDKPMIINILLFTLFFAFTIYYRHIS